MADSEAMSRASSPLPPHRALASTVLLVALATAGCTIARDADPADSADGGPGATTSSPITSAPLASTSGAAPDDPAAPPFISSATWGDSDFGITLRVAPTPAALRTTDPAAEAVAWEEVLALSPDARTPGMREQFECHWRWARLLEPDKATWNLEPWRPATPVEMMLVDGCNPGGPEV